MDWKTQKVWVAGSGKSGIGATDLLKKVGAEVIIYDGNDKLKEEDVLNKLENKEDVKAVSYTHLDVYKRQDYSSWSALNLYHIRIFLRIWYRF